MTVCSLHRFGAKKAIFCSKQKLYDLIRFVKRLYIEVGGSGELTPV